MQSRGQTIIPVEGGSHHLLGLQRLHDLDDLQVWHVDVIVLGLEVVLAGTQDTLYESHHAGQLSHECSFTREKQS
jgi:hypothetical protein